MSNPLLTYFQSFKDYFWQWEDDNNVIAIPNSSTIAYKQHLGEIIEKLSPSGLPPFGSLLMAIAATNPDGPSSVDVIYRIVSMAIGTTDNVAVSKAISFLKLLTQVPPVYRQGDKRILLFQAIFSRCHQITSLKDSRNLNMLFKSGGADFDRMTQQIPFNFNVFDTDFRTLSLLETKFQTVDQIIRKIADIPDTKQIQIDFEEQAGAESTTSKDIIDQLIEHNKTFFVGSLVRWLWGGLNIPVHSALPSEQPIGGISDLTNKGEFDKLLISEFAYDDLTFLSRLANNEALYFHREIPPAQNDLHRVILIDSSLKNWGNPRTIAFAVMLAIARHPKTDIACEAYVLGGDSYHPISFDSIHQVIDALMIIDAGLHAAEGLELFLNDHGADRNKEIFLITESSSMKQAPLLRVVNEHSELLNYLILTDDEGNVDVYKKHQRARKHVQHIKVPLETLWRKASPVVPKPDVTHSERRSEYPILFRHPGYKMHILVASDGEVFQVSEVRSILRFYDRKLKPYEKGWELVFEGIPFKTDACEVGKNSKGEYVFLLFNVSSRKGLFVNINTGWTNSFVFDAWRSTSYVSFIYEVWQFGDTEKSFMHVNNFAAWKLNLDGTVEQATQPISHAAIRARAEVLSDAQKRYQLNQGVFRNIRSVFISSNNRLVFNIHALHITLGDHIKLIPSESQEVHVQAQLIGQRQFRFPDGSTVTVNGSGMFILTSSDKNLPAIYVPSVLDSPLGVFAGNNFAGNNFFFKDPMVDVTLEESGVERLALIKEMRVVLPHIGLKECKELVDSVPSMLHGLTASQAQRLKALEVSTGAKFSVSSELEPITAIHTAAFYKNYIIAFVNVILKHGT